MNQFMTGQPETKERELSRVLELQRRVSISLLETGSLPEMLQRCVEVIVSHLGASFARIWTLNSEDAMLELRASAGLYTHLDGAHSRIPMGQFKIGLIARERTPHLTNSVLGDPRVHNQEWAKREGMVSFAGYPLIVETRLVGVLGMFSRSILPDATLAALASVANSIALGIERKNFEAFLHASREALEGQVADRTAELRQEVAVRRKAEEELRAFGNKLVNLRDEEQRRLARDLHDTVGQSLTAASMALGAANREAGELSSVVTRHILEAQECVRETLKEIRIVSYLLHPPLLDESGLVSALREYTEGLSARGDIKVQLIIKDDFERLPAPLETAIFRIVQECLTNVHRHSGSKTAAIRICRSSGAIEVQIADSGKGMPATLTPGVGLRGMRERVGQFGGKFDIQSSGEGTTVTVLLPIAKPG